MRLLVCGSRTWDDRQTLERTLDLIDLDTEIDVVIEGEAPGADTMARQWAELHGIPVERYPADWDTYGKMAGPIRNEQMLVEGKPDLVVAFSRDIANSRGTADMVRRAKAAGVPYRVFGGQP